MRYFITLAYHGGKYHGWQKQPNAITLQEELERAISLLLKTQTQIVGAGRTDTGVHAKKYIAHFDTEVALDSKLFIIRLNAFLPPAISILEICPVIDTAHARFDALSRSYEYHIATYKDPFLTELSYFLKTDLDVKAMGAAAQELKLYNNFKCFCKSKTDVKTYHCDIKSAHWEKRGSVLVFCITADRFLRNMVRAIVGTLIQIGLHKKGIADLGAIIASKDRSKAGFSVPAQGLYLTKIRYPKHLFKNPDS